MVFYHSLRSSKTTGVRYGVQRGSQCAGHCCEVLCQCCTMHTRGFGVSQPLRPESGGICPFLCSWTRQSAVEKLFLKSFLFPFKANLWSHCGGNEVHYKTGKKSQLPKTHYPEISRLLVEDFFTHYFCCCSGFLNIL